MEIIIFHNKEFPSCVCDAGSHGFLVSIYSYGTPGIPECLIMVSCACSGVVKNLVSC